MNQDDFMEATGETGIEKVERKLEELEPEPSTLEMQIADETRRRELLAGYIKANLQEGVDYYTITFKNGTTSKPSLSKPGSEKFMSLLHLRAEFIRDVETWEMLGQPKGLLTYKCIIENRQGEILGEGRGARDAQREGDVNKAIKMAQKSAQIDAILRIGALSDYFSQDLEDLPQLPELPQNVSATQGATKTPTYAYSTGNPTGRPTVSNSTYKTNPAKLASEKQLSFIRKLMYEKAVEQADILQGYKENTIEELSSAHSSQIIETLLKMPNQENPGYEY